MGEAVADVVRLVRDPAHEDDPQGAPQLLVEGAQVLGDGVRGGPGVTLIMGMVSIIFIWILSLIL